MKLYNSEQAANKLKCSPAKLRAFAAKGLIPFESRTEPGKKKCFFKFTGAQIKVASSIINNGSRYYNSRSKNKSTSEPSILGAPLPLSEPPNIIRFAILLSKFERLINQLNELIK